MGSVHILLIYLPRLVLAGLELSKQLEMALSPTLPASAFQVLRLELCLPPIPNCHFVEPEDQFISYCKGLV